MEESIDFRARKISDSSNHDRRSADAIGRLYRDLSAKTVFYFFTGKNIMLNSSTLCFDVVGC